MSNSPSIFCLMIKTLIIIALISNFMKYCNIIIFLLCHSTYVHNCHFSIKKSFSLSLGAICLSWTTDHSLKPKQQQSKFTCLLPNSFKERVDVIAAFLKLKSLAFSCRYFVVTTMVFCLLLLLSRSVVSNSVWPHRRQPTRLPRPWDSPGKNTGVGCHFLLQCLKVKSESEVAQSCPALSYPMDCSLPGSSIHGIFQARVLEWGAIAFSGCSV